jgi:transcriptional regulator with XRE-family HTH domain
MTQLRQKREELNLTQIEAAMRCGVSLYSYQLWEKGAGKPACKRQAKVIEVMGLPEDYFEEK